MANNQRTITIPVDIKDGRVTLSYADFQRLLSHVTGREVVFRTQISLEPKPTAKRGPKPKKEE